MSARQPRRSTTREAAHRDPIIGGGEAFIFGERVRYVAPECEPDCPCTACRQAANQVQVESIGWSIVAGILLAIGVAVLVIA